MRATHRVFDPFRTSVQAGIIRNIFNSSPHTVFTRHYSALVSASLRKQLRNHTPTIYSAFGRRTSSLSQVASGQRRTITNEAELVSSEIVAKTAHASPATKPQQSETPAYEITFTCKPCQTRSTHKISKQGYHKGTILITCPDCKNRHLICDHLNIFRDQSTTIEDILKEKGEHVRHGTLGVEGDIEIWDDGTTSERATLEKPLKS